MVVRYASAQASKLGRYFGIAALVVIADQITKLLIVGLFTKGQSLEVTSFFSLLLAYNPGAAFSFLAGASGWQCAFFSGIAVVAATVISVLIARNRAEQVFCYGLALILGGAVGNVIDRARLCAVVDFLLFHWHEYSFPAFNVADSCITIGAGLLIFDALRKSRAPKAG